MRKIYLTNNPSQTKKIGEVLAKKILKAKIGKMACVLGLEGSLGGGKTTFLQGFAKGLGVKEKITSPTFVIMKKYELRSMKKRRKRSSGLQTSYFRLYHIDCYRLQKPKEILALGFKEIISNPENIVAIEWADKIKRLLPKKKIMLTFEIAGKNRRKIVFASRYY